MKNLIIALCLIGFAGCVNAQNIDNSYETEKTYTETSQNKSNEVKNNSNSKKNEQYQRRIKFSGQNNGASQSGTHYNFGNGNNYGFRGSLN